MSERPISSVMDRVRKILTKTTEAGCTVEEARNAFALASKILAAHNLSMDDVKVADASQASESFIPPCSRAVFDSMPTPGHTHRIQ